MSLKIDRVQLEIVIQQDDGRRKLMELEDRMRTLRKEVSRTKEGTAEYIKKTKELQQATLEHDKLIEKIGVEGLSLKQLAQRQKELNQVLAQLPGNSKLYEQYKKQLDEVNGRIKELKGKADETRFSLKGLADGFNRYAALATTAAASLAGITLTVRKSVEQFAELEETMANVRKYTGMTAEQVRDLNESFKKMDTRASREDLNNLASDAGKLGIEGKKNILDFVEAANIINVSLGEDLGQDAIKNIGKLAMMFGEDKRLGLKQAMLSVGSAINQVAQTSSASEPYLAEFLARTSGIGNQAKISASNLMGFASVLDQNMQQVELSSTALSGVLMKMYKDPAKFAQIAGLDVAKFTDLVKKDANEALLTLLDTLGKAGGMDKLAPIFDAMKLDGARASSVLSVLAGNIANVREQQKTATDAYNQGTSVIQEYNIQNNTLQAKLDKTKKGFQEVSYELGERMYPFMGHVITSAGTLVRGLNSLIGFTMRYAATITSTLIAIAAYTAAVNAKVIADKLSVFWTEKVIVSMKALKVAIASNPWAALVIAIGAAIGLLIDFRRRNSEVTQSMKSLQSIQETANSQYIEQSSHIKILNAILHNNKISLDERRKALEELNSIIPGYNAQISDEGKITRENTQALKDYLSQLQQKIMLEATKDELTDLYKKRSEQLQSWRRAYVEYKKQQKDFNETMTSQQAYGGTEAMIYGATQKANQGLDKVRDKYTEILNTNKAIQDVQKSIAQTASKILPAAQTPQGGGGGGTEGGGGGTGKGKKELNDELRMREQLLQENKAKELLILEQKKLEGTVAEEQYQKELYNIDLTYLEKRRALYEDFGKDTTNIQMDMIRRMEQYGTVLEKQTTAKYTDAVIPKEENPQEDTYIIDKFRESSDAKLAILEDEHARGLISEQEYQDKISEIQQNQLQKKEETTRAVEQTIQQVMSAASDVVNGLQEIEIRKVEASYDKKIKAARKAGKDTTKLEEQKEEAVNGVKKKYADAQFAMAVLQATSTTAVTAMESYKAMAGIPYVGPALGAAAAAAAIAAGAIQIAIAKQQRDEAKGLYSGGYSEEYVTGYTKSGNPREVAGVIPVHKSEFVATHEAVANPAVRQVLDVFDIWQKQGTIRMKNTTDILNSIIRTGGMAAGGYSSTTSSGSVAGIQNIIDLSVMNKHLEMIEYWLEQQAKYGGTTIRDLRTAISKQEAAEKRASRGANS